MIKLNNWFINHKHIVDKVIISDYVGIDDYQCCGCYGYGYGENVNDCRGSGHFFRHIFKGYDYGDGFADGCGYSDGSSS